MPRLPIAPDLDVLPDELASADDVTLVFLRHKGCLFTRELIQQLRDDAAPDQRVVLVHQSSDAEYDRTLADLWPDAERVSDPGAEWYAAFDVRRGGWREMFGWRSWRAGVPAFLRGNRIGWKGAADGWTLPSAFRLRRGVVVASHRGRHAGDQPRLAEMIAS